MNERKSFVLFCCLPSFLTRADYRVSDVGDQKMTEMRIFCRKVLLIPISATDLYARRHNHPANNNLLNQKLFSLARKATPTRQPLVIGQKN
jgi:hypothetical protein